MEVRQQSAYRADLVCYMQHPIDVGKAPGVAAVRLVSFMGDDTVVALGIRAHVGERARTWTDRDCARWAVRQQLDAPFQLAHLLWELRLPAYVHTMFTTRGTWLYDDRSGSPYQGDPAYHPARGLWRASLWDMLLVCDLWTDLRTDPVLRAIATHFIAVVRTWVPLVWDSWQQVVMDGVRLSNAEMAALRDLIVEHMFRGRDPSDVDQERLVRAALERRKVMATEQDALISRLRVRNWRPR